MSTKRGTGTVLAVGALAMMAGAWACSGGTEGPDVTGPGPGWDESPAPMPPGGEPSPTPTVPVGGGTTPTTTTTTWTWTTTTTTTTTTTDCASCYEVMAGALYTEICAASASYLSSLISCACGADCYDACYDICNGGEYIAPSCTSCANTYCPTEVADCAAN